MMNMQRLILEVKKREILWNRRNPRFKDKLKTDMEWENVAATVRIPTDMARKKWRNLRDTFMKEFQRIPKFKLDECEDVIEAYGGKWLYFNHLIFLLPTDEKTGFKKEIDYINTTKNELEEEFDLIEMTNEQVDGYIDEVQHTYDSQPPGDQRIRNHCEAPAAREDENLLFLRSLHPYMKRLSLLQQLSVRTKFQEILLQELQNRD